MRFCRWIGVLVLVLGCGLSARAQLSVYGTYSATGLSGIKCFDPQGQCSSSGGKVNLLGGLGGLTYDFRSVGPVRLGVDVRAGRWHSNKSAVNSSGGANSATVDNVLGGVKATFPTYFHVVRPYAQVSAGWARSDATEPIASAQDFGGKVYDDFIQYEAFAGLDIKVFPVLDLRLIELGIGNMNRVGSAATAGSSDSAGVKSIGIGVVFHLP